MTMMKKGKLCKLPIGLFFFGLGISSLIYTPFEFLYDLRLRMLPGTPGYEYWADPPENILMTVYIFNITNHERFLNGTDDEIHLQEIGPIIFREKLTHTNIVFHENSTLTYTATRTPIYLPEINTINLNDTMIAFNLAVMTTAAYFQDSPFFLKASINMLLNRYKSQPIVKTTIYNYLLNFTDPFFETAQLVAGSNLISSTNVGTVHQLYLGRAEYNVTVFIGPKYGHNDFFNINNWNGYEHIPEFKRCLSKFDKNTSETTLFPQFMKKGGKFRAYKNILCRLVDLEYTNETSRYGMAANRYDTPLGLFNRTYPSYLDCYKGNPPLPNGIVDISACYKGFPLVASFPHFLGADPVVLHRLKGFNPDVSKHGSFLTLEKYSGVPVAGRAIFQMSARTGNLKSFTGSIPRFSNMYIPMSYVGYEVEGLPWYIYSLLYTQSVIIPNIQLIMSLVFIVTGLINIYSVYLYLRKKISVKEMPATTEGEKFIK